EPKYWNSVDGDLMPNRDLTPFLMGSHTLRFSQSLMLRIALAIPDFRPMMAWLPVLDSQFKAPEPQPMMRFFSLPIELLMEFRSEPKYWNSVDGDLMPNRDLTPFLMGSHTLRFSQSLMLRIALAIPDFRPMMAWLPVLDSQFKAPEPQPMMRFFSLPSELLMEC